MAVMKQGLDYFSLDVDFFEDPKIEYISARFGMKGEIITLKLLARIYRNGYFLNWDDDQACIFAKKVGNTTTTEEVNEVISELIRREFFNERLYREAGVLTSRGIQRRYFEAVKRRKVISVKREFLLIETECKHDVNMMHTSCRHDVNILKENVNILEENADILKQKKGKEKKGNERKRNETERKITGEAAAAAEISASEENETTEGEDIGKLFIRTFSRLPNFADRARTENLIKEFGFPKTVEAFYTAREKLGEKINLAYIKGILTRTINGITKEDHKNEQREKTGTMAGNTWKDRGEDKTPVERELARWEAYLNRKKTEDQNEGNTEQVFAEKF